MICLFKRKFEKYNRWEEEEKYKNTLKEKEEKKKKTAEKAEKDKNLTQQPVSSKHRYSF